MKLLILQPSNLCDMNEHSGHYCSYCSFAKHRKGMDRVDRLKPYEKLLAWIDEYTDPDGFMIHFIGGEPSTLPHSDIFLDEIAKRGYWTIFQTHGLNKINPAPRLMRYATWHNYDQFPEYADVINILETGDYMRKIAYCEGKGIEYLVGKLIDHTVPPEQRLKNMFPTHYNKYFNKSWLILHSGEMRPCNRKKVSEDRKERPWMQQMHPPDWSHNPCPQCPFIHNFEELMTDAMKAHCDAYYEKQKQKRRNQS